MKKIMLLVPMHITFQSFINPSTNVRSYQKKDGRNYNLPPTDLPLGMLSISAYLKKHAEVDVRLIDFNVLITEAESFPYTTFYDFASDILENADYKPDFVGVSCLFSSSFKNFLELGAAAKRVFPNAVIIGGGNVPTSAYRQIYSGSYKDTFSALCFGEGELPMLELVRSNDIEGYTKTSKQWVTHEKAHSLMFQPEHNFIDDLDEIPFFDYGLCDIEKHNANLVVTSFASVKDARSFHVITSRGCPFKCTFCASHAVHGRKVRAHSVARVKDDFTRLKEQLGAKTLVFQDDHYMFDRDRVYAILRILKELDLNSIYQSGLALYALNRPMLEAFFDAGVRQLALSVESGCDRVLKHLMKKPLKLEISQRVADDCRDIGIYTNANILIGIPGETKEDIKDARKNLGTINCNWFHINCASPLVGSEMHEIALQKGFIRGDTLGSDYKEAVVETDDFSIEYIQSMQYLMNLELNFVNNADMRLGEYNTALAGFNNVIKIKRNHAFAYYYGAKCYKELDNIEKAQNYYIRYQQEVNTPFWAKYAREFQLPSLDMDTNAVSNM